MDFTVKRVTLDDYDKVVGIREDIYDGADTLPVTFKECINHPSYEGYAAVKDGEIISFLFVVVVDDGETAVTRASRIRKEFQGKGLYKLFLDKVKKLRHGNIFTKRITMTIAEDNLSVLRKIERGTTKLIMERNSFYFKHNKESSIDKSRNITTCILKKSKLLTSSELMSILELPSLSLFPEGRIICGEWIPFRAIVSNIPLIAFHAKLIIGTYDPHCTCMTFGTPLKTKIGIVCTVTVYGNDFRSIREHLAVYKSQCQAVDTNADIHIWIHLQALCKREIKEPMLELGFSLQNESKTLKCLCVEEDCE